jgi:hypothetical protein
VAEHAVVTTLVTVEGRTLTEVKLMVKNQAQPFLRVALPKGATIVSADVAGEKVKPVQGPDGNRVPLLRTGFRPNGPYEVSFVFMDSSAPFAKKGGSELALPSMDVPISLLEWELFLPEQYKVKDFGGDAIAAYLLPMPVVENGDTVLSTFSANGYVIGGLKQDKEFDRLQTFASLSAAPGQIGGIVVDSQGAVISGAKVTVTSLVNGAMATTTTDSSGQWLVNAGLPAGKVKISATAPGFKTAQYHARNDPSRPSRYMMQLSVGESSSTVEVTAEAPLIETTQSQVTNTFSGTVQTTYADVSEGRKDRDEKKAEQRAQNIPSANVLDLQKRVAGVLPVRVDVPRAGNSYRFARALVLDEETKVTFNYKTSAHR